jgi:hypothetical protein
MSVNDFGSIREALEFLVGRVAAEAEREGSALSEVERKMLYFSETDWTLPDILEVNKEFERLDDENQYEARIEGLVQSSLRRAQAENEEEYELWTKAVDKLREGDYYFLVMIDAGSPSGGSKHRWLPTLSDSRLQREPGDRLRLWLTALACVFGTSALLALYTWAFGTR